MLLSNSITFAVFIAVQSTTSLIFQRQYTYLAETLIGVCFRPTGLGALIGSVTIGKLLDWSCKRDRKIWVDAEMRAAYGEAEGERKGDQLVDEKEWLERMDDAERAEEELSFPLEKTRLKVAVLSSLIVGSLCIGFGWCVDRKVSLAVPLVFQFGSEHHLVSGLCSGPLTCSPFRICVWAQSAAVSWASSLRFKPSSSTIIQNRGSTSTAMVGPQFLGPEQPNRRR